MYRNRMVRVALSATPKVERKTRHLFYSCAEKGKCYYH